MVRNENRKKIFVSKQSIKILLCLAAIVFLIVWTGFCKDSFDILICRIAAFLAFAFCIIKAVDQNSIFNPYLFFSLVPLSLFAYDSSVSTVYFVELKFETWLFALSNIFIFLLSYTFIKFKDNKHSKVSSEYDPNKCLFHSILMFGIYSLFQILRVYFGYVSPLYSTITLILYPSLAMAWKSGKKPWICCIYILLIIFIINTINKTLFLFVVMTTIYSYWKYHDKEKLHPIKLILATVVGVTLMLIVFNYKAYLSLGGDFNSFISEGIFTYSLSDYYLENRTINWGFNKIFAMPYIYLIQAWNNLQYVMETQRANTYGLWMIKPLLGWLRIEGYFSESYVLTPYSNFNTFTYLAVFYKDFGPFFAWIGSVILAVFLKYLYKLFSTSNSPFVVGCYALASCATFEMFFSNHFFQQSYPFTIILISSLYYLVAFKLFRLRK